MKSEGFNKAERIVSQKLIDELFVGKSSHSMAAFPIKAVFIQTQAPDTLVLISVPKKRLHHAVDRNRAKRQLREAYRLNKHLLVPHKSLAVAFIWMADTPVDSRRISQSMRNLLQRMAAASPS